MSRHMRILSAVVVLWGLVIQIGLMPHTVQATSSRTLEATFTHNIQNGWVRVERWRDTNPNFKAESYPPDGRLDQTGQRLIFFDNVARPASGRFLLYYAPGWDTNPNPTPVLLVHGAFENADWAWANPAESPLGCGAETCPTTGLMQYLSGLGYKVFAISYPHGAGDNYYWAEQIYDAIQIIKSRTGASQVDVVAWSKGTVAGRMYVSSVRKTWGTAYAGDVRRLIMVGGLNNGWDWPFRHGTYSSLWIFPECGGTLLGGSAHTNLICWGFWYYHPELSIYKTSSGDFFPGLRQMLKRWDGVYPLPYYEPDYWTTYYGGWGYYSYSNGITYAINQGSLINKIRSAGVPSSVSTYLLCGGAADIPNWHNEHTGPSDGTVFVASCSDTSGIGTVGGNVLLDNVNHLELVWESSAMLQIESWLR